MSTRIVDIALEQEEFNFSEKVVASVIWFLIQFPCNFGWLGLVRPVLESEPGIPVPISVPEPGNKIGQNREI